jgi:hypothetical protein
MTEQPRAGRGRLARVLATRGGQAAPEAPFVIEHREALIYMLCEAAEIEHAIMCQYLYAAFSLKQSADEGLTDTELAAVDRWRQTVSHIATQEMLHLALVQNLLSAVGAAPHFTRPNLPQPAGHYPPGVVLTLVPFGEQALRHFMFLERPEGMDLNDADGIAATERAAAIMQEGEIVPRLQDFATVGHLYRSVEGGIRHLCDKYGEEWLFVGPPDAEATPEQFRWPELVVVTDAGSAQLAIDTILEQGEGPRGLWRNAHFGRFVDILDEYLQLKRANPAFEPARPVLPATVRPSEGDAGLPLIGDPLTASCTDLFNVCYEVLLQALERYFAHTDETSAQLGTLADLTVGLMFTAIKPLGQLITTLPVGPDQPGSTAGPSFELFYESDYLLPHRDAAWALIEERLREATAFAERLRDGAAGVVASRLDEVAGALLGLAHTLAEGRAAWGGADHAGEVTVARRRQEAITARAAPGAKARLDELASALRRAAELEQAAALHMFFAAASLKAGVEEGGLSKEQAALVREWKRDLLASADEHFGRVTELADALGAVTGEAQIAPLPRVELRAPGSFSADHLLHVAGALDALPAVHAELRRRLDDTPSDAVVLEPYPSAGRGGGRGAPAPLIDKASVGAVIDTIAPGPGADALRLRELAEELATQSELTPQRSNPGAPCRRALRRRVRAERTLARGVVALPPCSPPGMTRC